MFFMIQAEFGSFAQVANLSKDFVSKFFKIQRGKFYLMYTMFRNHQISLIWVHISTAKAFCCYLEDMTYHHSNNDYEKHFILSFTHSLFYRSKGYVSSRFSSCQYHYFHSWLLFIASQIQNPSRARENILLVIGTA